MRRYAVVVSLPFILAVAGCVASPIAPGAATDDPAAPPRPDEPPPWVAAQGEGPAATSAAPSGHAECGYTVGEEPAEPAAPTTFCLAESLDRAGRVVAHAEQHVEEAGGVVTALLEHFDAAGELTERGVTRTTGGRLLYESSERFDLDPEEALPYTYGEAATWATTYTWDAAERLTVQAWDRAMDGTIDSEERWAYHAGGGVREHVSLSAGALYRRETFAADGQPLSSVDAGGWGRRWLYDGHGLLQREETLAAGAVSEYVAWEMAGPAMPLRSRWVQVQAAGEAVMARTEWSYADGKLHSLEARRWIDGFERRSHVEYDARGREVRAIEDTESPDCHRYERRSTYAAGPDNVLSEQLTTCDGELFERIEAELDEAGRPLRVERVFAGNPLSTTHQLTLHAYDACGAVTLWEHFWNGDLTTRQRSRWDPRGQLLERFVTDREGREHSTRYVRDQAGRLVRAGDKSWTYDAEGRVTRFDLGAHAAPLEPDGPIVATVRYTHDCAPR